MAEKTTSNRVPSTYPEPELTKQLIVPKVEEAKTPKTRRRPPSMIVWVTTKQEFIHGIEEDDDEDDSVNEEESYGKEVEKEEYIVTVASPRRFLDTQFGNRKDVEHLMVGDSPVIIDTDDNFTIKETAFKGTDSLWELSMRKNVNTEVINKSVLKTYNKY